MIKFCCPCLFDAGRADSGGKDMVFGCDAKLGPANACVAIGDGDAGGRLKGMLND